MGPACIERAAHATHSSAWVCGLRLPIRCEYQQAQRAAASNKLQTDGAPPWLFATENDALVNVINIMGNGFRFAKQGGSQGLGAEVLVALYEDSVAAEDRSAAYASRSSNAGQAMPLVVTDL